jgi:hypothetical protein
MSEIELKILICDQCGKKLEYNQHELHIGGHPTNGWISLEEIIRSSISNNTSYQFDFCSYQCLKKFTDEKVKEEN